MRKLRPRDVRPEDLKGKTYAQYIRDSTADQAEGYGPEIQRRANQSFAQRYELVNSSLVYEEYISAGSVRGRDQLLQAIADLRAELYQVLLVGWTHRLARSTEDAASLKRQIADAGGFLVYSGQGIISGQRSSRVGENILHVIDQEYRDNLSDLVTNALQAKYDAGGANGVPPLGTRHVYVRRDGTIADGPERHTRAIRVLAEPGLTTVRALFTHYVQNGSYRKTAEWLNDNGHRTREGVLFTFSGVRETVQNPFYGPEEVVRYHRGQSDEQLRPTLKDQQLFPDDVHELWARAQEKRELWPQRSARQGPGQIYPLHVVLRCDCCGSTYHGQADRSRRVSRHAGAVRSCTPPRTVPTDLLEGQLSEALQHVSLPKDWQTQIRRIIKQPPGDLHADERILLAKRIDRLRYQHLCEAIDDETFRREFRALKGKLNTLPLPSATHTAAFQEPAKLLSTMGDVIGHPAVHARPDGMAKFQRFCELAFQAVAIDGRRLVRIQPKPCYAELFAVALASKSPGNTTSSTVGKCAVERT